MMSLDTMIPRTIVTLLLFCTAALAQTPTTGRIAGTVKDANGAVIAGAQVTVVNKATRAERSVTSDATGNYAVPALPPGAYRLKVTAQGFNQAVLDTVPAVITETISVDVTLVTAGPIVDPVVVRIAPL